MVPAMAGKEKSLSRSVQNGERGSCLSFYGKCLSFPDIPDGLTTFQHPDSFSQKSQDKYWWKLEKQRATLFHSCVGNNKNIFLTKFYTAPGLY